MEIKEISRSEYDEFLRKIKNHSFYSTSKMAEVKKIDNAEPRLLGLVDGEEILAVAMTLLRKMFGGSRLDLFIGAYGINEEYEFIFYDKLKDYAKDLKVLKLMVKPDKVYCTMDQEGENISYSDHCYIDKMKEIGYIENDGTVIRNYGLANRQFVKDMRDFLPDDEKKLLKSFNNNARRKIKKAKELGINVRKIKKDEIKTFKALTQETADRQGFLDKSLQYYERFYDEFKDEAQFLTSEIDLDKSIKKLQDLIDQLDPNGKNNKQRIKSLEKEIGELEEYKKDSKSNVIPLANMILIYQDDESIYFYGGSQTKYHKLPGAFILQYDAMLRTMQRNLPLYNFFGINGDFDGNDGVLRFKQNFNGYVIIKSDAFLYYPNPGKYKRLNKFKAIGHKFVDKFRKEDKRI